MFDPCKRCKIAKNETFRKVCQGTPYSPGLCELSKAHWRFVGDCSVSHAIGESYAKTLHRKKYERDSKR